MEHQDIHKLTPQTWNRYFLEDATCAFDAPYTLCLKKGNTNDLIVWLDGGGMAWDEESAGMPMLPHVFEVCRPGLYKVEVENLPDDSFFTPDPTSGMRSAGKENPFRDWNVAFVSYGTGDFHTGTGDYEFTDFRGERCVAHMRGFHNLHASLKMILEAFPTADRLLICGESAGAFGVSAVAGEIIDAYPDCQNITVFSDSAMATYDNWKRTATELWHAPAHIVDAIKSEYVVVDWFTAMHKKYGNRVKYLFSCGSTDHVLAAYQNYMTGRYEGANEADLEYFRQCLTKQVAALKAITPDFGIYIHEFLKGQVGPGVLHCWLGCYFLTQGEVDGVVPVKWLMDAVEGNVYDVGMHYLA